LATDGLYEWENGQGEQIGQEWLEKVIREARESSSKEIIHALYKAVLDFAPATRQRGNQMI